MKYSHSLATIFATVLLSLASPSFAQIIPGPIKIAASDRIGRINGVAVDSKGRLIISDAHDNRVSIYSTSMERVATSIGDGTPQGVFQFPGQPCVTRSGSILVPQRFGPNILVFSSDGVFQKSFGDDVIGRFNQPMQVAEDQAGYLWVADMNQHCLRLLREDGTYVSSIGSLGKGDGQFSFVGGVATMQSGNVVASDILNNRLSFWTPTGAFLRNVDVSMTGANALHPGIIHVAGDGTLWVVSGQDHKIVHLTEAGDRLGEISYANLTGTSTPDPVSVVTVGSEVLVADATLNQVLRFDTSGTYLGSLLKKTGDTGRIDLPHAAAMAANGEVWVADSGNHRLSVYSSSGEILRTVGGFGDGNGQFQFPTSVAIASDGLVAVTDTANHRIQILQQDGTFVRAFGKTLNGAPDLNFPSQALWGADGSIWVVDTSNSCIKHYAADGTFISKIASTGSGQGELVGPTSLAIAPNGDIYVSDTGNHRVQRFDADGTYLGGFGSNGSAQGQFVFPSGLLIHKQGLLTVSDSYNHRVQVFRLDGTFMLEYGTFGDGAGQFFSPELLMAGPGNSILFADSANNMVGQLLVNIDVAGPTSTIAFSPSVGDGWSLSDVTSTITSLDNDAGVRETRYKINTGLEQVVSGSTASFTLSDNGIQSIAYYAIDNAGNTETTKYATVRIDKTRPTVDAFSVGTLVTVIAQDTFSGVASTKVSVDGAAAVDYTGSFTVAPGAHTVSYWATDQAGNESTREVVLVGVSVASVAVSPTTLFATKAGVGTVKLSLAAPVGGVMVMLDSNSSAVSVPVSVTVPARALSATFPVTAGTVSTDTKAVVTASVGGQEVDGTVYVLVPFPKTLTLAPSTIIGGDAGVGTVALASTAGMGGQVVNLTSSNTSVVIPATVTVPSGATTVTFPIQTSIVGTDIAVAISAEADGAGISSTLLVKRVAPKSIAFAPSSVIGGNSSVATLTVTKPAPAGGIVIDLRSVSSNVTIPATVTVAAGATTATFTVTTVPLKKSESAMIQAYAAGVKVSAFITVTATSVVSVTLNPSSVVGGLNSTATVTLNGVAPVGGTTIQLYSTNVAASVPTSVVVLGGSKTVTFPVTTVAVAANTTASIAAKYLGTTKSAALTIAAPTVSTLTLAPSSLTSGATSKLTIKLSGKAAVGGVVVALTSSNTVVAQLPTSVTIPAGSDTVDVTIQTGAVAVTTNVTITAKTAAVAKTAVLTVNK